ncbi:MAG: TlpA family protein disulfide reductase [Candidatus Heimdallarchaeaceae archaeon]
MTDVDSKITYKLSDFTGKPVMLDFFATWCTYCVQALPHLVDIYEIFGDDIQIISIDVDEDETDSQISSFRKAHDMDWIVGSDKENIGDAYGVSGIPHFVIIDQDQIVSYQLIGFAEEYGPIIKDEIYKLLPDTVAPTITDFQYTIVGDNLSIYSPEVRVFANITEDREVYSTKLILSGDSDTEVSYSLNPKRDGDFFIINETVSVDVAFLYPQDEISAKLIVSDFKGNEDISSVLTIPITHYDDTSIPEIVKIDVEVSEVSDKFQIDVGVVIQEDLFFVSANATLLKNYERWYPKPLMQVNSTFWETSFTFSKTMAHLCELNLTIELMDVASNIVNETLPVPTDLDPSGCEVEEPTEPTEETDTTEPTKTPISTFIVFITLFSLASIYYVFNKK